MKHLPLLALLVLPATVFAQVPTRVDKSAPGLQHVPAADNPSVPLDDPQTRSDRTTMNERQIKPMVAQPAPPNAPSAVVRQAEDSDVRPQNEAPHLPSMHLLNFIGPYRGPTVPKLPAGTTDLLQSNIREGRLYLPLHDAIVLAIENNLDVEISRYSLFLADSDLLRAKGGGTLRGIDQTISESPQGVGGTSVPLLITSATQVSGSPTNINVEDLSQVTQSGSTTQQNLSMNGSGGYTTGPNLPFYDPTFTAQAGYFRRSNQTSLLTDTGGSSSTPTSTPGSLSYLNAGVDYQEGFSPGTQIDIYANNSAQVLYGGTSQYNPFHSPSSSLTVTQPLLRGFGRGVNLRFVHIARLDTKISQLVFMQQVLELVYGISRLYYDLVSLGENVGVKEQSLAAAEKLYEDDGNQVELGTLPPIELTRARALLSSSRLDLIQARDLYRQQQTILRQQILRRNDDSIIPFHEIIPTDRINVPDNPAAVDVATLIKNALANRPDLVQASLQLKADEVSLKGSRNGVLPNLSLYGNVQARGSNLVPYQILGSPGSGEVTVPAALFQGGLRLATVYQGGVQLSLPLRNRIAEADATHDVIQLRQAESRRLKLENDIRQQVENSAIALDTAQQAYAAAVESTNYQQELLQAELDKLSVGASTNLNVIQDEAYLSQARATEVAARSDWIKARIALDRFLGDLLEKNHIVLDDAISEKLN